MAQHHIINLWCNCSLCTEYDMHKYLSMRMANTQYLLTDKLTKRTGNDFISHSCIWHRPNQCRIGVTRCSRRLVMHIHLLSTCTRSWYQCFRLKCSTSRHRYYEYEIWNMICSAISLISERWRCKCQRMCHNILLIFGKMPGQAEIVVVICRSCRQCQMLALQYLFGVFSGAYCYLNRQIVLCVPWLLESVCRMTSDVCLRINDVCRSLYQ